MLDTFKPSPEKKCDQLSLSLSLCELEKIKVNLPYAVVTLALGDFGYPVYALWFTCSQRL
jgi:hypothetical protein